MTQPAVAAEIEQALRRLGGTSAQAAPEPIEALVGTLEQCQSRMSDFLLADAAPIRTVHHLACSGGTLISRALACLPNVMMMSEIDPFSTLDADEGRNPFHPSDLIADLNHDPRNPDGFEIHAAVFRAGLGALRDLEVRQGRYLVLRDHAHSQFCSHADPSARPTLRAFLAEQMPVLSILTVRHPLDSFMSLTTNKWLQFAPPTIEEYARRYGTFLDAHEDVPLYQYEGFVTDPHDVLQQMARDLELPFDPEFDDLLGLFKLTGDSGRRSNKISARARRAVSPELANAAAESPAYASLCERLGYDDTP